MMRRKYVKLFAAAVALLLAGIMLFSTLASSFLYVGAATNITNLKKQLSGIQQQKEAVKSEMNALGDQLDVASERKAALDRQMELTQDEIDTTESLIKQLALQIEDKEAELAVAEKELQEKADLFATRVRVMYESGDISYLDVLLSSDDLGDMLSRMDKVSQIMDYDNKVVLEYKAAKEDIASKKASLEQDQSEQLGYKNTLQAKYRTLDQAKEEQQKLMDELNANLDEKKRQAEKMAQEQESINSEIERLSRLAAEEARRKAQQNGSSSGSAPSPVSGSFTWPLPGYGAGSITSPYGYRTHPITGTRKLHAGIDLGVPKGTTIVAAKSGTVVKSCMSNSYGNYTVIDHGGGVMTAYAHQSKRIVSVGQTVSAGQTIGLVGSTGNSTGNHLHFEVYVNGSSVNPMQYFN